MVKELDWSTLEVRRELDRLCGMHKAVNQVRGWEEITSKIEYSNRIGRGDHAKKMCVKQVKTDVGKYSFINRTVKSWNALNEDVALIKDAKKFRKGAEKWLAIRSK